MKKMFGKTAVCFLCTVLFVCTFLAVPSMQIAAEEQWTTVDFAKGDEWVYYIKKPGNYRFTGNSTKGIQVLLDSGYSDDAEVKIMLDNLNINAEYDKYGLESEQGALDIYEGKVTLVLRDGTVNTISSKSRNSAGIRVGSSAAVTIQTEGTGTPGVLHVLGGEQCAGIGCNENGYMGDIIIKSGNINAEGGWGGAGIGTGSGGMVSYVEKDNIRIEGGSIRATGGYLAVGIGAGGVSRNGGSRIKSISISGGTIIATNGIGGGEYARVDSVKISGGVVTGDFKIPEGNLIIDGNCIVNTDKLPQNQSLKKGIVYYKSNGNVYGSVSFTDDFSVSSGKTLTIGKGRSLTIGKTVSIDGTLTNHGTFYAPGKLLSKNIIQNDGLLIFNSDDKTLTLDKFNGNGSVRRLWDLSNASLTITDDKYSYATQSGTVSVPWTGDYQIYQTDSENQSTRFGIKIYIKDAAASRNIVLDNVNIDTTKSNMVPIEVYDNNVSLLLADGSVNKLRSKVTAIQTKYQESDTPTQMTVGCEHAAENGHICKEGVCGKLELESTTNAEDVLIGYSHNEFETPKGCGGIKISGGFLTAKGPGIAIGQRADSETDGAVAISGGNHSFQTEAAAICAATVQIIGGDTAAKSGGITATSSGMINGPCLVYADSTVNIQKENGILFQNGIGEVYGTTRLPHNLEIPSGNSLKIQGENTLVVPSGIKLTNHGDLSGDGTIFLFGSIDGAVSENIRWGFDPSYTDVQITKDGARYTSDGAQALKGTYVMRNIGNGGRGYGNISVDKDVSADIFLSGVTVDEWRSYVCPIKIADGSTGNVNLILTPNTKNRLTIKSISDSGTAAVENRNVIGTLRISCANKGEGHICDETCGRLDVQGGRNSAGIGGGNGENSTCGPIVIDGGNITASGGSLGTGIGSGKEGAVSSITINGGIVTAVSNSAGAAIGSGEGGKAESVTITGGIVTATSKDGSGIGEGKNGVCGSIQISGGTVNASGAYGIGQNFSTGTDGKAVILTNSIEDSSYQTDENTSGLLLVDKNGRFYGDKFILTQDITIENGDTFTIDKGQTLTIDGAELTNYGTLQNDGAIEYQNDGTLQNDGAIEYQNDGTLMNFGALNGDGTGFDDIISIGNLDFGMLGGGQNSAVTLTLTEGGFELYNSDNQTIPISYTGASYLLDGTGAVTPNKKLIAESGRQTIRLRNITAGPEESSTDPFDFLTVKSGASVHLILEQTVNLRSARILVESGGSLEIDCAEALGCTEQNCTHTLQLSSVDGDGEVTVSGGKLTVTGNIGIAELNQKGGTLNIENGEITGSCTVSGGRANLYEINGKFIPRGGVTVAQTISYTEWQTETDTQGLILCGNRGILRGNILLKSDLLIPEGTTLKILEDGILNINSMQVTNRGLIQNAGVIQQKADIQNVGNGKIMNDAAIAMTVTDESGAETDSRPYGETIHLKAIIQDKAGDAAELSGEISGYVDFCIDGDLIESVPVTSINGVWTAETAYTLVLPATDLHSYEITAKYSGSDDLLGQKVSKSFQILKAALPDITAEGFSGVYDGQEHGIAVSAPDDCTVSYSYWGGEYSMSKSPVYTNAGNYTVYYSVSKDNYEEVTGSVNITITAKKLTNLSVASPIQALINSDKMNNAQNVMLTSDGIIEGDIIRASGTLALISTDKAGTYQDGMFMISAIDNTNYSYPALPLTLTSVLYQVAAASIELSEQGIWVNTSEECDVIVAIYDKDGKMTDVKVLPVKQEASFAIADLGLNMEGAAEIRVMVWKDMNSMKPLCEATVSPMVRYSADTL